MTGTVLMVVVGVSGAASFMSVPFAATEAVAAIRRRRLKH